MAGGNADENEFGWALVRRTGFIGLLETIMDRRSRTQRARTQGRTITGVARVLARSGTMGEVAVVEGDGTHWTVTITPSPAPVGSLMEDAGA